MFFKREEDETEDEGGDGYKHYNGCKGYKGYKCYKHYNGFKCLFPEREEGDEEDEGGDGYGAGHVPQEGEPDFIETNCHWIDCAREFETQDELVKVG